MFFSYVSIMSCMISLIIGTLTELPSCLYA